MSKRNSNDADQRASRILFFVVKTADILQVVPINWIDNDQCHNIMWPPLDLSVTPRMVCSLEPNSGVCNVSKMVWLRWTFIKAWMRWFLQDPTTVKKKALTTE